MKRTAVLMATLLTAGCAAAEYKPPMPTLPTTVSLPPPPPRPVRPDTLPMLTDEDPVKAVRAAQRDGLVKPRREWFKAATYMPPYHPNHNYLVYIPEGNTTIFQFSPGEKLQPADCSDGGVILAQTYSSMGVGADQSWVWKVKAKMTGPRQDCTITTNRGVYTIFIELTKNTHTSKIRWSDPYGYLAEPDMSAPDICTPADENYTINGDEGAFGLRLGDVSNDGSHTCIRFPQSAGFDLPAVWLIEGEQERPATPAMIDGAYLIDGVPPIIELRTDNAKIRIERAPQ